MTYATIVPGREGGRSVWGVQTPQGIVSRLAGGVWLEQAAAHDLAQLLNDAYQRGRDAEARSQNLSTIMKGK